MKRTLYLSLLAYGFGIAAQAGFAADTATIAIDPAKVLNRVDEKVYGHFLEHIYHSVNGGLWGDLIWNRSFEDAGSLGGWKLDAGQVVQKSQEADVRLTFGDPKWRDYEFTLEARKTGGAEGFLVLFRVKNQNEFYWYNLGGWQNKNHGLERGLNDGNRWRTIGKVIPGSIETGKWYKIRVRCEGPHLRVWLDDRQVLDLKDDEKAHLAGKVGIGTWATQARFRNLKVTSLDGKGLFQGLPEVLAQQGAAPNWTGYGPGKVALVGEEALNGDNCQSIEADGSETGLQQTPLCVRKDDPLGGSLWARGNAPEGLIVRLLDGDKKLAEQTLPPPSEGWKEYPFELKIPSAVDNATIQVGVRGEGKVWIDQVSLMAASARKTGGFRPDLLKAVAELRAPIIRWPGGCYAEHYRWQHGVGPQHKRIAFPLRMWDDRDVNSYGTDEFIAMCRKTGSEPLLVINIGRHDKPEKRAEYIADACAWIEYCNGPATSLWGAVRAANGHPEPYNVKYWEIDNETWGMGAENYAKAVCEFAPAMKKADPSIVLLACGSGGLGNDKNGQPWNRTIIESCAKHVDYLSVHHYENPNNYRTGPERSEAFLRETARLIAASQNPKMKVYCSEWNAQSTDWRTGLYAGGLLNAFERCGDFFEIGGPALFLRHVSATGWDNAFVNFDHRTWFPAPNYVVMKLWRDHYAPQRIAVVGECGPLNAVATRSADGRKLCFKAVNATEQAVPLKIAVAAGFPIAKAALEVVAPGKLDARNTLDAPNVVHVEPGKAAVAGQTVEVTFPPLSAGVVVIETQGKNGDGARHTAPSTQSGAVLRGTSPVSAPAARVPAVAAPARDYPIRPVPFTQVHVTDPFWGSRLETNRTVTIPYAFKMCEETGRIDNFAVAGKLKPGKFRGIYFNDSDVFKVIEGAAYSLANHPDPKLEAYLDDLIAKIAAAQEPDGYLYTARTLAGPDYMPPGGKPRWSDMGGGHELYCVGHLYEGAVAHFLATKKRTLLDVAIKNADLVCSVFGPEKKGSPCGHQEVEIGLVKLYRVTGDVKYLNMAKFFLDARGRTLGGRHLYGTYAQDHKPVIGQSEAVGHAVRAGYMYSGMADVAALTGDADYVKALERIWGNVAGKKLYITGGMGARGGGEAFGDDYELPNLTAYCETCAAIANALWNHRMFLLHGDAKYLDVVDRVIYNGFLSGVSLEGNRFFYPNPLESHRGHSRSPWFDCACCPSNVVRFVPSIPGYAYAQRGDDLYVNLFIAGSGKVQMEKNLVEIKQETRYPWDGAVKIGVEPEKAGEFAVCVRIPGWARNQPVASDLYRYVDKCDARPTIRVNGTEVKCDVEKGFARLRREWKKADTIELNLPMPARRVRAHEQVAADAGRVALERGPIVFCAEWPDNKDKRVLNLMLPDDAPLQAEFRKDLLGGVEVVTGKAVSVSRDADGTPVAGEQQDFTAIPNYAWAHRGPGQMAVWLAREASAAKPLPGPTIAATSKVTVSSGGSSDALADQLEPRNSKDHSNPFFHWWPRKGTLEWVQFEFKKAEKISSVEVYWFDDTGIGECRLPKSWSLKVKRGGQWQDAPKAAGFGVEKDKYNKTAFDPIEAEGLRLEIQLPEKFAAGIHEVRIK